MPCPIQIKENITKEINDMSGNYINRSPSYIEKLKTTINNRFKAPVVDFFKQNDDTYLSSIKIPQSLIDKYYQYELTLEGDKEDYYQNVDNEVKPGVLELFDSNSELDNIGTPEQYSQYLNTIFPNSKVKDIVYHGTKGFDSSGREKPKFDKFDKVYIGKGQGLRSDDMAKGFYFGSYKIADRVGTRIIPAILNVQEENTTTVRRNTKDFDTKGDVFVVFEPEQIHILGSKQDIEEFKKFVNNKNYNTKGTSNSIFNEYGVTPEEWNNASESEREMIIWQSKNQC